MVSPAMAALAVVVIGTATILGAWGFELIAGLEPCPLCLEQRIPYYAGIPVAAVAWGFARGAKPFPAAALLVAVAAIMLYGAGLGVYHAGIEWQLWAGPSACAGAGAIPTDASTLLQSLDEGRVPSCTEAAWRFLGLSFAGYNALIALGLAAIAGTGAVIGFRGRG